MLSSGKSEDGVEDAMAIVLEVDRRKKKKLARRVATETISGTIAVGVTLGLLICSIVLPTLIYLFTEGIIDNTGSEDDALFVGAMLFIGFIIALGVTWKQRTAHASSRKVEKLALEGSVLHYSFAFPSFNQVQDRSVAMIDFSRQIKTTYDAKNHKFIFEGDISSFLYRDVFSEYLYTIDELDETNSFELYAYFEPALEAVLAPFIHQVIE